MSCLSDSDIDRLITPVLGPTAIPARAFYDVRTGRKSATALQARLIAKARRFGRIFAPLHVRHHWVSTVIRIVGDQLEASVFDSAPSSVTKKDICHLLHRVGIRSIEFCHHPRQPRGSLECGLHVVLRALMEKHRTDADSQLATINLGRWRLQLHHDLEVGGTPSVDDLFTAVPEAAVLFATHHGPEGAGSDPTHPPSIALRLQCEPLIPPTPSLPYNEAHDVDRDSVAGDPIVEVPLTAVDLAPLCNGPDAERIAMWLEQRAAEASEERRDTEARTGRAVKEVETAVMLRNLPASLRHLHDDIARIAQAKTAADLAATRERPFDGHVPGVMLSDTVIDAALRGVAQAAPELHVLQCGPFSLFARTGRAQLPQPRLPNQTVVLVAFLPDMRHFIEMEHRERGQPIVCCDSLGGSHSPNGELARVAGRFLQLLSTWGRHPRHRLEFQPCGRQLMNDCGIEAVRNVLRRAGVVAASQFSRKVIAEARKVARESSVDAACDLIATRTADIIKTATPPNIKTVRSSGPITPTARNDAIEAQPPSNATSPHSKPRQHNPYVRAIGLSEAQLADRLRTVAPGTLVSVSFVNGSERPAIIFEPRRKRRPGLPSSFHWFVQWENGDSSEDGFLPPLEGYSNDVFAVREISKEHAAEEKAVVSHAAEKKADIVHAIADILPGAEAQRPHEHRPCCGREKLDGVYCAWHHPKIRNCPVRPLCRSMTAAHRKCQERVLMASDGQRVIFDSNVCWYHASDAERQRLRAALAKGAPETTGLNRPDITAEEAQRPAMAHGSLRKLIFRPDDVLHIVLRAPELGWPRCTVIARLATPGTRTRATGIDITHRFCTKCDAWHSVDLPSAMPFPSSDATYFEVRAASDEEVNVASNSDLLPDCCDDEIGSDLDEDADRDSPDANAAPDLRLWMDDPNREPLLSSPDYAPPACSCRTDAARKWYLYPDRPPHVHRITWNARATPTRREHLRWLQRIKGCSPDLERLPLPRAAIELVLRLASEKQWRWSTIASKLSSIRGALKNLPLHSSSIRGFDIGEDPFFAAAQQHAQKQARVEAVRPLKSRPLTFHELETLKRTCSHVLATISWWTAARVGDARRLEPRNVEIDLERVDDKGFVPVRCLFTKGKGAHFWGPYAIHTKIPVTDAKPIAEHVRVALERGAECLCSDDEQRALSKAIAALPDASLRSIRRGSLKFFSDAGAIDSHLQLLSGHKNRDTLLRYLGFGMLSSEASNAAAARTRLIADEVTGAGIDDRHPMWMGPLSGFSGKHGRRTAAPPELFPSKAPSIRDLTGSRTDTSNWPLHVKADIVPLDITAAASHVSDPELRAALEQATAFLHDESLLGATWAPLAPHQLPLTRFTAEQWRTMYEGGKAIPLRRHDDGLRLLDGGSPLRIRSACRGFAVPQHSKKRLRPVFEPLTNRTTRREHFPPLAYPPRQQRRAAVAKARYSLEFDFRAWYDQVCVGCRDHYVCRATPTCIEGEVYEFFALTRVPMGATFSAHLMQTLTWGICEHVLGDRRPTRVHTMVDNVRFFGDDADDFADAIVEFLTRCELFGAQLNDADCLPRTRDAILAEATVDRFVDGKPHEFTFLGETFVAHRVRNSTKNVENLSTAFARLQQAQSSPSIFVTRRQVASFIGLATFMMHTLEIPIREHFDLLRLFSQLARSANAGNKWDVAFVVDSHVLDVLARVVGPLLKNEPVTPSEYPLLPDSNVYDNAAYDAVVITDASGSGMGAVVQLPKSGETFEYRRGWPSYVPHSAWAEPMAAIEAIRLVRGFGAKKIALVTDHDAMCRAQRRPESGTGGFSGAFYLNKFYQQFYGQGSGEIFYVPGERNPADAPSRATIAGDTVPRIRRLTDTVFPHLSNFTHPFRTARVSCWWNV